MTKNKILTPNETKLINTDNTDVSVQSPLPNNLDRVYANDVDIEYGDIGDFSGEVTDFFDNLHTVSKNVTANNPKTIKIWFKGSQQLYSMGFGCNDSVGSFSNIKITLFGSNETTREIVDFSSDDTKYKSKTYSFAPSKANGVIIEFYTEDEICLSNVVIWKVHNVNSQLLASDVITGNTINIKSIDVGALLTANFLIEVARGNIPGYNMVHKFGAGNLTTTPLPITSTNNYATPIANTSLEFVSDSADDSAIGLGAQEVTIIGLVNTNGVWSEVTQTLITNGLTPVILTTDIIRMYRWYVSKSGTYASPTESSHVGNLTIQESGGGTIWDTIPNSPLPFGQSQIGVYTVPSGKTAYLFSKNITVDSSKASDIFFFQRPNANDVTAPYTGTRRLVEREIGITSGVSLQFKSPKGPFVGPCDIGFIGRVDLTTGSASVEFELLIVDD
jgi:hypothetical protein